MTDYDPRQVRNVLRELKCTEIMPADPDLRYFQNDHGMGQVRMSEPVDDDQIEILCQNLGRDLADFKERLKKDKKHKK